MLRCLTKKKRSIAPFKVMCIDLKKGFYTFLFWLFFFHFFGLHWVKLRDGIVKIMGVCVERRGKKEEKQFLWKENLEKKKKRPGRDSNPRSFSQRFGDVRECSVRGGNFRK